MRCFPRSPTRRARTRTRRCPRWPGTWTATATTTTAAARPPRRRSTSACPRSRFVLLVKAAQWAHRSMAASSYRGRRSASASGAAARPARPWRERWPTCGKAAASVWPEPPGRPSASTPSRSRRKGVDAGKDAAQRGGAGTKPSETRASVATSERPFDARLRASSTEMIGRCRELGEAARSQVALAIAAQEAGQGGAAARPAPGDARFTPRRDRRRRRSCSSADDMLAKADEQPSGAAPL